MFLKKIELDYKVYYISNYADKEQLNKMNSNQEIKTFFESKICDDVIENVNDFVKPHLFKVGDNFEVKFRWEDYEGNVCYEKNHYTIIYVHRNEYCSEVYLDEKTNGDYKLFDRYNHVNRLFIYGPDKEGSEWISFAEFEEKWDFDDETEELKIQNYIIEAKDM
jgi:hypothetical protein